MRIVFYDMWMVVVVTGGSAGIGKATALAFADKGYDVAVMARGEERVKATVEELKIIGVRAMGMRVDVADADQVEQAAVRIEESLGDIDIWVNNAMVTVFSEVIEMSSREFKRATEVSYLGMVYGTLSALRRMWVRNRGTIVLVGSALAYRGIPLQSAYCGAKHAVKGFFESLRAEIMHNQKKVHLSMVQLPGLNTPQFSWSRTNITKQPQPVPPIYNPRLAAEAIVFATENKRREVWLGAPVAATINMNKLLPGVVDSYLARKGYSSQFTKEELEKEREGNLFEPVEGKFGIDGRFVD